MDKEYFQLASVYIKTGATKVIIIISFIIIFITQENKHITKALFKSDSLKHCKKISG